MNDQHQHLVFRCIQGFGNRLCNLMNMFYIHEKYPKSKIYLDWRKNNHCNIGIEDIIDITQYKWILSSDDYYNIFFPKYRNIEMWASTSVNERTKWDKIEEWNIHNHKCIVSVSFNIYEFVPKNYCINTFNSFIFKESIHTLVNDKINKYGLEKNVIHFRNGDLIKILGTNGYENDIDKMMQKIDAIKNKNEIIEYNKLDVDRKYNDVLESVADLIFISKYCNLTGYSTYSHFSSWIFLLSKKYVDDTNKYPIFNSRILDIILLD